MRPVEASLELQYLVPLAERPGDSQALEGGVRAAGGEAEQVGARHRVNDFLREPHGVFVLREEGGALAERFFHGGQDRLVPVRSPQRMVERLRAAGVASEMVTLPSAGHISPVFDPTALKQAIAFADRHLKAAPERQTVGRADSPRITDNLPKGRASHGQ